MPAVNEIKSWYRKNGWPTVCYYCGSPDGLTKDHIEPKSKTNRALRTMRYQNKGKDPKTYYAQFELCCKQCNQMKSCLYKHQFVSHLRRIVKHLRLM